MSLPSPTLLTQRQSSRSPIAARRRRGLLCAMLVAPLAWVGCTTPPPVPAPPPPPPKQDALRSLGFVPADEGWQLDLGGRVVFQHDDATLSAEALATLARMAQTLLSVGIDRITVEGHTDNQGSQEYNRRLSERRAEVVAQALVKHGFSMENLVRRGHGSSRPIADNSTEAGRLQNRRAVLIVSSM
ncbi:OmpA family protein [soil metagenome]